MIDAPLYIANTEATLRAIVLASKVAKMIDRKHRQALAISSEKKTNSSYQYELISPFDEINRMVKTSAPGLVRQHFNAITEILAKRVMQTIAEARSRIATTVFPGLSAFQVNQIVTKELIPQRIINKMLRGASPTATASILAITGNPAERQRLINEYFRRLRTAAYSSVRTGMSSMYGSTNQIVYDSIPADVIGFQVLGILDNRIRPKHRARHGTIYYKNPGVGRPGFAQMPNPPLEEDGSYAYNCRCTLIPVFKGDDTKARDIKGRIIPNAKVFSEWFDRQSDSAKKAVVGVKRFKIAAQRRGGGSPNWIEFLDAKTGILMTDQEIKNESNRKRINRIRKLASQIR